MYHCEACRAHFYSPSIRTYINIMPDGHYEHQRFPVCPQCGEDAVVPMRRCPDCQGWMERRAILCEDCRNTLLRRFCAFADALTPAQSEQLNEWLDGDTIEHRKEWS